VAEFRKQEQERLKLEKAMQVVAPTYVQKRQKVLKLQLQARGRGSARKGQAKIQPILDWWSLPFRRSRSEQGQGGEDRRCLGNFEA
jgi:hypothetical protein